MIPAGSRRPLLRQTKLRAVVAAGWGPAAGEAGSLPGGATLLTDAGRAWVLVDEGSHRSLGGALAWAVSRGVEQLDLVVDAGAGPGLAGLLAWRAAAFARPPAVWELRGSQLAPAAAAAPPAPAAIPDGAAAAAAPLGIAGVDVVAEHGVLRGEVLGLEVARVVADGDGWRLDVGVGTHDRAAGAQLRPGEDPLVALERAAAAVRERRRPGVARHPANTLARERWLRAVLVAHPELVDAAVLAPAPPALPRPDLLAPAVAPAVGRDLAGRPLVVVASTGIDSDVVPAAADARRVHAPSGRLVVAVPAGDDHPVTRRLAGVLAEPATVAVVPPGWEAHAGGAAPASR